MIVRNDSGALCGYVGVPPGHPWHEVDRFSIEGVRVHGGLSFSSFCQEGQEEGPGVCHVPEPGRPENVWWLGFDTHHPNLGDISPGDVLLAQKIPTFAELMDDEYHHYRNFEYVKEEVENLAMQVSRVKGYDPSTG